jgi:hypothetical protein
MCKQFRDDKFEYRRIRRTFAGLDAHGSGAQYIIIDSEKFLFEIGCQPSTMIRVEEVKGRGDR